jgi:hypothetical protein
VRRRDKNVEQTLQFSILLPFGRGNIAERVIGREYGRVGHGGDDKFTLTGIRSSAQLLQRRIHVRIGLAGDSHHLPVQPFGVDVRRRRGVVGCFLGGVGCLLSTLLREVFGVVCAPSFLVCEVSLEVLEKVLV